jgi:hypothetical protein
MKKIKGLKNAHASNSKIGMGDFYGTGIKNPLAKIREFGAVAPTPIAKLKKPPKKLA